MKALSINPPLHPSSKVSQSTNYYSDSEINELCLIAFCPSKQAEAEKAQQEPQDP